MTTQMTYRNADGHTVQQAIGGTVTVDGTNDVDCPVCGERVTLDTDRHGELRGYERRSGRWHRHRGDALRDPEALAEALAMRDEPSEGET